MKEQFLSEKSVADLFDVSQSTVKRLVEAGHLPRPITLGRLKRWRLEDLLKAPRRPIDGAAGKYQASADADIALQEAINRAKENTSPRAGERHHKNIRLFDGGKRSED